MWLTVAMKFLGPVFDFLTKYWKIFAIVLIIGGTLWRFDILNKRIAELETDKATCIANQVNLQSAINQRNEEIDNLNDKLRESEADVEEAIEKQKQERNKHKQELKDILNEKNPETCEGAIKYLIDGTEDLKW